MSRALACALGAAYAVVYLVGVGDIAFEPDAGWLLHSGDWTLERAARMRSPFLFEALAVVEAGRGVVLISPGNILVAGVLGGLLAVNVHGAVALRRAPQACGGGVGATSAALPALAAGPACCAPGLLLLLGMPSLGALASLIGYLVPASMAVLLGSRLWQLRRGAPPFLRAPDIKKPTEVGSRGKTRVNHPGPRRRP